ncbi:MAG TPA: hypothetical protein VJP78_05510 [Thermoleophilia bacterium]|nr:hypothetical protein [Thermoleophilia bacterium]
MDVRRLRHTLVGKLGGEEDRRGHHVFFYFEVDGQAYGGAKLSHSARGQLHNSIVLSIARKLKLNSSELEAAVSCQLEREAFENILRTRPRQTT